MQRVVPRQVVAVIDRLFSWAATQTSAAKKVGEASLESGKSPQIAAVVDLVENVRPELLTVDNAQKSS